MRSSDVDDDASKGDLEPDFCGGCRTEPITDPDLDASAICHYYPGDGHDPRTSFVEGHLGIGDTFKDLPLSSKIAGA